MFPYKRSMATTGNNKNGIVAENVAEKKQTP
jgi:hypothetical protein